MVFLGRLTRVTPAKCSKTALPTWQACRVISLKAAILTSVLRKARQALLHRLSEERTVLPPSSSFSQVAPESLVTLDKIKPRDPASPSPTKCSSH